MPAVVDMDNGIQNGARTDHDRNSSANGANGIVKAPAEHNVATEEAGQVKAKEQGSEEPANDAQPARMNDLPEEIPHITEGFIPLSMLLTRLAQRSHNELQHGITTFADLPQENYAKHKAILEFAQEQHEKWVKALVITDWSKKAEVVSKLIDLRAHMNHQQFLYDSALDEVVNLKRNLAFARIPSPDLKTALQVLSTGSAPWMPDVDYIEPPQLSPEDQLKWLNELNTILSLRLNLEEFDRIPPQFRDYTIASGRVTFKVEGEFEVDLTVADEDPERQFWFIDFRFAYQPAPAIVPETILSHLEANVNMALNRNGLAGCYQFLHEFVLTCKINELKRQALLLEKTAWTGTLKVEPLHRALAIQYWSTRLPPKCPKSWLLIAVHSDKKGKAATAAASTSHLELKWYRDNAEVKSTKIEANFNKLEVETILNSVIRSHIDYILQGIYDKASSLPRYANQECRLVRETSLDDPLRCCLTAQLTGSIEMSLHIEPKSGVVAIKPQSKYTIAQEHKLNTPTGPTESTINNGSSVIASGFTCLQEVRCNVVEDEIVRRSSPLGWQAIRPALKDEEIRSIVKMREWSRAIWLRRSGWPQHWYLVAVLSQGGDDWWLIRANSEVKDRVQHYKINMPMGKGAANFSEPFWNRLTLFTTALISQYIDMRTLHAASIKHHASDRSSLPATAARLPAIDLALSDIFPAMVYNLAETLENKASMSDVEQDATRQVTTMALTPRQPWAKDDVVMRFITVQGRAHGITPDPENNEQQLTCVSEAITKVHDAGKLGRLKGRIDQNTWYSPAKGEFALQLRYPLGESGLQQLKSRVTAIDRFVCFLEALGQCTKTIENERVTMRGVSFFYANPTDGQRSQKWRVVMDLSKDQVEIALAAGNPHLRVLNYLRKLVNIDGGIKTLMIWLPQSLPVFTSLENIKSAWDSIQEKGQGRAAICCKNLDWLSISYTIMGTNSKGRPVSRQLSFEAVVKLRKDGLWWHIHRAGHYRPEDRFGKALEPVFGQSNGDWIGMGTSAAGKVSPGAAMLFDKIDEVVKGLVGNLQGDEGFEPPPPPQVQQRPVQEQRQQQPPPPQHPQQQQQQRQSGQPVPPQVTPVPIPQVPPMGKPRKPSQTKTGRAPDQAIEIG